MAGKSAQMRKLSTQHLLVDGCQREGTKVIPKGDALQTGWEKLSKGFHPLPILRQHLGMNREVLESREVAEIHTFIILEVEVQI